MVSNQNIGLCNICKSHFKPFISVLSMMNSKYRATLCESKKLNGSGLLQKANASNITADKILYDHAIQIVRLHVFSFL